MALFASTGQTDLTLRRVERAAVSGEERQWPRIPLAAAEEEETPMDGLLGED